ncbi:MAG TPA: alpha-isopropylmalate synthase regulatory domain-containing protein, partial [Rhizomicrobium sp.]|nr:alpha-isopropylmalate synthase regulatory domain-containing protein [Rhizomicrobium sp.]
GDAPDLGRLLQDVKRREFEGYSYDDAQASFELLALRQQKKLPAYFTVDRFSVTVESARDQDGDLVSRAHAVVEMTVAGQKIRNTGGGNGPVNALDSALRMDLGKYSSYLADLRLVDYKVRILTSGTEAVTRVTVESADGKGERWSTVGVSENIVDASFEALTDSIVYKLYRDKAQV